MRILNRWTNIRPGAFDSRLVEHELAAMIRVCPALIISLLLAAAPVAAAQRDTLPTPTFRDPFIVFFDSGSAAITPVASRILDNATIAYRPYRHCRLEVLAKADRAGPADYNLALSKRRADAVVTALRKRGLRLEARIVYTGEDLPLVETDDGVAEAQNRFASFMVECPDGPR